MKKRFSIVSIIILTFFCSKYVKVSEVCKVKSAKSAESAKSAKSEKSTKSTKSAKLESYIFSENPKAIFCFGGGASGKRY